MMRYLRSWPVTGICVFEPPGMIPSDLHEDSSTLEPRWNRLDGPELRAPAPVRAGVRHSSMRRLMLDREKLACTMKAKR